MEEKKIVGVEIDFVAPDVLKAFELYERIFDLEQVEATDYPPGSNEVIFTMYGTRFHMLDENMEYHLAAPKEGDPKPMWINVAVPDIKDTYQKAMAVGCVEIQPVVENEAFGASNAVFMDPFGYMWMLHQIYREVEFDERRRIMEEEMEKHNH